MNDNVAIQIGATLLKLHPIGDYAHIMTISACLPATVGDGGFNGDHITQRIAQWNRYMAKGDLHRGKISEVGVKIIVRVGGRRTILRDRLLRASQACDKFFVILASNKSISIKIRCRPQKWSVACKQPKDDDSHSNPVSTDGANAC